MQYSFSAASTSTSFYNIADRMADLRRAYTNNPNALSFLEYFENADTVTQKQIGAFVFDKLEQMNEQVREKQREKLKKHQSQARLPAANPASALKERNLRNNGLAKDQPPHQHQPYPQRQVQSQDHRKGARRDSSVPSSVQARQFHQESQGNRGNVRRAPNSDVVAWLARNLVNHKNPLQTNAHLHISPSRSTECERFVARQHQRAQDELWRQQRQALEREPTRLKKTSKPLQKVKSYFSKCSVPPHAIYHQRKEDIKPAQSVHHTCGHISQSPSHHFWENRRNQLTNDEINQHYFRKRPQ